MLNPEHMSVAEKQFIRTYVQAMRRDFSLVESVMALMHPDQLAITDVMTAVRVATELQHMQAEFESTLHNLPSLRAFARKPLPSGPTLDDLADLFALSFFKVFTVLEDKKTKPKKKDAGWFSGQPEEWHKVFKQMMAEPLPTSNKKQSSIFNMFSKFFPQLELFKNFHLAHPPEDTPLNAWPLPGFGYNLKKNQKLEYDDEEYDEDEED